MSWITLRGETIGFRDSTRIEVTVPANRAVSAVSRLSRSVDRYENAACSVLNSTPLRVIGFSTAIGSSPRPASFERFSCSRTNAACAARRRATERTNRPVSAGGT